MFVNRLQLDPSAQSYILSQGVTNITDYNSILTEAASMVKQVVG
jgi:hypothetical protein